MDVAFERETLWDSIEVAEMRERLAGRTNVYQCHHAEQPTKGDTRPSQEDGATGRSMVEQEGFRYHGDGVGGYESPRIKDTGIRRCCSSRSIEESARIRF